MDYHKELELEIKLLNDESSDLKSEIESLEDKLSDIEYEMKLICEENEKLNETLQYFNEPKEYYNDSECIVVLHNDLRIKGNESIRFVLCHAPHGKLQLITYEEFKSKFIK